MSDDSKLLEQQCDGCQTPTSKKCSHCKNANYCSKECQKNDRRNHKLYCVEPFVLEDIEKKVKEIQKKWNQLDNELKVEGGEEMRVQNIFVSSHPWPSEEVKSKIN